MNLNSDKPDIVFNINKPIGWSSNDIVRYVKRTAQNYKVGHAGTLDPFADGVLLVCVGNATKRVNELMNTEKEYFAHIKLGLETDTLDISGNIVKTESIPDLNLKDINKAITHFSGEIDQIPPAYSALKVNGQRSYHIARNGGNVELEKRKVKIYQLHLKQTTPNTLEMRTICSKGTYIRSLAKDICYFLNTIGYVQKLSRLRVGEYDLSSALPVNLINGLIKHSNN